MTRTFTLLAASSALAVVAGVALTSTSAQAAEITPGRAQMYAKVSGPVALTGGPNHVYSMVIGEGSKGKWMGERKNSNGKKRTLVGKLTAKDIVNHWSDFKYTKAGVLATLAWDTKTDSPQSELVKLGKPTMTNKGVKFRFVASRELPTSITGASINLRRAPKSQALVRDSGAAYGPYTYNIADDLWTSINVVDSSYEVDARIYNSTNDNTCWTGKMYSSNATTNQISVKQNTCDNIQYKNFVTDTTGPHGVNSTFDYRTGGGWYGQTTYALNLTPKNQSMYEFNQVVAQWNWPTS